MGFYFSTCAGHGTGTSYPTYSTWGQQDCVVANPQVGAPKFEGCAGTLSTCYTVFPGDGVKAGLLAALGRASTMTIPGLEGSVTPVGVLVDHDSIAIGHVWSGISGCTAALPGNVVPCEFAYVPMPQWERNAPSKFTPEQPDGVPSGGTYESTAPS